jgi:FKBP-type peptidyl-prolyl cis-trans isomerase 2
MTPVKFGDSITVNFIGKLDDGTIFDSSEETGPLEFTVGQDGIISGFSQAVVGMEVGESRTVRLEAESAFGPYIKELVQKVDRNQFPAHIKPEVGQVLQVRSEDGLSFPIRVIGLSDQHITLDANHPLAGKPVTFEIQVLDIKNEHQAPAAEAV